MLYCKHLLFLGKVGGIWNKELKNAKYSVGSFSRVPVTGGHFFANTFILQHFNFLA